MLPFYVSHISNMAMLLLFSSHHPSCKTWLLTGSQNRSTAGAHCNWCWEKTVLGSSLHLSALPSDVAGLQLPKKLTGWGSAQTGHFPPISNYGDHAGRISWIIFPCLSWRCVCSGRFLWRMYTTYASVWWSDVCNIRFVTVWISRETFSVFRFSTVIFVQTNSHSECLNPLLLSTYVLSITIMPMVSHNH